MRFYDTTHKHTCGIDLHARTMYLCVLDKLDQVVCHWELPNDPAALLDALVPFREDLVIGVECMFSWSIRDACLVQGDAPRPQGNPRQARLDAHAVSTSSTRLSRGQ